MVVLIAAPIAAQATAARSPVSPVFFGTAHPKVAAGGPGKLQVIGSAPAWNRMTLYVMVKNNTKTTYSGLKLTASGAVSGSGDRQGFNPVSVAPGQVALGYVHFATRIPAGATPSLALSARKGVDKRLRDLGLGAAKVVINPGGSSALRGTLVNPSRSPARRPLIVDVFCFKPDGSLSGTGGQGAASGSGSLGQLATAAFAVQLGRGGCPTFLVAASGRAS